GRLDASLAGDEAHADFAGAFDYAATDGTGAEDVRGRDGVAFDGDAAAMEAHLIEIDVSYGDRLDRRIDAREADGDEPRSLDERATDMYRGLAGGVDLRVDREDSAAV